MDGWKRGDASFRALYDFSSAGSVLYGVYLPYGIRCRYIMVKLLPVEASIGAQLLVSREIIEIMGPG